MTSFFRSSLSSLWSCCISSEIDTLRAIEISFKSTAEILDSPRSTSQSKKAPLYSSEAFTYARDRNRTGTGLDPEGFSYHYSFHCHLCLWSGLSLYPIFRLRYCPSSLYTFLFRLGSGLPSPLRVKVSPNLSSSTFEISFKALNFSFKSLASTYSATRAKFKESV